MKSDTQAITYWIIRYVPDVARGEFQNIGIVCGSDHGDWAAAFDWRHIHNRTPRDVREWASWFSGQVAQRDMVSQDHEFTRSWIEGIRQRQANSVQISDARPVVAKSSRQAAEFLFPHLVEREHKSRSRRTTRRQLRSEVRGIYSLSNLSEGRDYFDRPEVRLGKLRGDFDFVQVNERLPIVRNVWAFDMTGLDDLERSIQAWNYEITRLRDDGATLVNGDRRIPLPSDSVVTAIIDPPMHESPRRADIYAAALESWQHEKVDVLSLEQFDERADQLSLV